jgi:hypothetical protein
MADFFIAQEIAEKELAKYGLNKEELVRFETAELKRIMTGKKSDVHLFTFTNEAGRQLQLEGKLSLKRNEDHSVTVLFTPVRKQMMDDIGLSDAEKMKLYTGQLVSKHISGERYLIQLDRETNELLKARTRDIKLPFDFSKQAREKLLTGGSIHIETPEGGNRFTLDLLSEKGYMLGNEQHVIRYVGEFFTASEIDKETVRKYNLSEKDIQHLLDGQKTGLIKLDEKNTGKLALIRNTDRSVSVQTFPVKDHLNNDIHLNEEQIKKLQAGELVTSQMNGKTFMVQLDRDTSDLLVREYKIPQSIRDIPLKKDERDRLGRGLSVTLQHPSSGENITARIDFNHVTGMSIKDDRNRLCAVYSAGPKASEVLNQQLPGRLERDKFLKRNNLDSGNLANSARAAFDERQKFLFDYHNPGVMGYIQTDRNRNEFMLFSMQQSQGYSVKY